MTNQEIEQKLTEAFNYIQMGEFFSARILLDELEEEDPDNGEVCFGQLLCAAEVQNPQQLACCQYDYELCDYYEKSIRLLSPADRAFLVQCSAENKKQLTDEQFRKSVKKFAPEYYEEHYGADEDDYEDDEDYDEDYDDDEDYEDEYEEQGNSQIDYTSYPFNPIRPYLYDENTANQVKAEFNQKISSDAVLVQLFEQINKYYVVLNEIKKAESRTGMFDFKGRSLNSSRKRDLKENVIDTVSKIVDRNLELEILPLKKQFFEAQAEMKTLPLTSPARRSLKSTCQGLEEKIDDLTETAKYKKHDFIKNIIEQRYFR